jgi:14-3-3 protein epsilon
MVRNQATDLSVSNTEITVRKPDVLPHVHAFVKLSNGLLNQEERSLLSIAYRNLLASRRASYRVLLSLELAQTTKVSARYRDLLASERERISRELAGVCEELIAMLDFQLLPHARSGEPKVFYLKLYVSFRSCLSPIALVHRIS